MKYFQHFLQKPWLYLCIVLIGVSLKFYRPDYKLFWFDEICTIGHTSGNQFFHSPVNEIKNISFYTGQLHLKNRETTLGSQLKGLFSGTNLTPLHYPFLMIWYRTVGDDPIHYRLFSVFIFLITLPFLFLLARTLFQSGLAGWIAISLYAVSPYIHLYALEARYYILWAFFLIIWHYLLLKAIQQQKLKGWIAYSIIGVLALYTSVFSGIILFGHALYVWFLHKNLRLKYSMVVAVILICYSPWMYSIFMNSQQIVHSLEWHKISSELPIWGPLINQLLGFVRVFSFYKEYFLFWDNINALMSPSLILEFAVNLLVLVFIVICFIFLMKRSKKKISWFIVLMLVPGFIFFFISDIARNSITSVWLRYLIFNTIGIFLLVSYYLSQKLKDGKSIYILFYAGIILISLISVITISKHRHWYLGGSWQQKFIEDARFFSQADHPLVITDYSHWLGMGGAMVVFNECDSDAIDILQVSAGDKNLKERIPMDTYSDIYVFHASEALIENLTEQFTDQMQALTHEDISPMWQINLN